MKKAIILIILSFLAISFSFGSDITYEVIADTPLCSYNSGKRVIGALSKGEKVYCRGEVRINAYHEYEILVSTEEGKEGFVEAGKILLESSHILPEHIISKWWIYDFYQDILAKTNRETLFKHETFWRDDYEALVEYDPGYWGIPWWRAFSPTCFDIQNNLLIFTKVLAHDKIEK
jgi:hypothetical protein